MPELVFVAGRHAARWRDLDGWRESDIDVNAARFRSGIDVWIVQTYLHVRDALAADGWSVRLSDRFEPGAICVAHWDELHRLRWRAPLAYLVGVRAYRPPLLVADWVVRQNTLCPDDGREVGIANWPQPGIRVRDPWRGGMFLIMRWFFAIAGLCLTLAAGMAQAQQEGTIWSCRDQEGRTHVTNMKADTVGKNCKVVQQSRVQVIPAAPPNAKPAAKPPTGFPKEDANARASAKERQREILERELAQEDRLLAQARKELGEQEAVRYGVERNYARVLERLQPYKDKVERHEKNVESLKRELANLYR